MSLGCCRSGGISVAGSEWRDTSKGSCLVKGIPAQCRSSGYSVWGPGKALSQSLARGLCLWDQTWTREQGWEKVVRRVLFQAIQTAKHVVFSYLIPASHASCLLRGMSAFPCWKVFVGQVLPAGQKPALPSRGNVTCLGFPWAPHLSLGQLISLGLQKKA